MKYHHLRHCIDQGSGPVMLLLGAAALAAGLGLFLWRGRPMLFALLVGAAAAAWCALWALLPKGAAHGVLLGLLLVVAVMVGLLEGVILLHSGGNRQEAPQSIVVLGAAVWEDGPSPMLKARLDTALALWETYPQAVIVVTGGQGTDEKESEAAAMAEYLVAAGVPEEQILLEDQAYNTAENLKFSAALLEENGMSGAGMVVVSNGYHLCRVELLGKRLGLPLTTQAAPTPGSPAVKVYYYARESLGLVKSWLLDG